jgi:hypothetical protein
VDPNNPDLGIEVFISQKEEAQIILDASFSNKDYYAFGFSGFILYGLTARIKDKNSLFVNTQVFMVKIKN